MQSEGEWMYLLWYIKQVSFKFRFQDYEKGNNSDHMPKDFCQSIEEYDPQTNKWREVGKLA